MPTDDQNAGEQQNQQGEQPAAGKYNPQSLDDAVKIISALTKRLDERDSDLERLKGQVSSYTKAQQDQMREQGKYKDLADQYGADVARLRPFEERTGILEKTLREVIDARIASVPESMRSIIPMDYPPERLVKWLNDNAALLSRQPAPDFDADAGAGKGGNPSALKLTPEEKVAAKRAGVSEEEFLKAKARRQ